MAIMQCRETRMYLHKAFTRFAVAIAVVVCCGLGAARAQTPDYAKLLAAPDRTDADRDADKRRDPLPFLQFTGARPGMTVLDMGAGGGYSTELMARAVAPNGKVWGQYPPDGFPKAIEAFQARLKTPAMSDAAADVRPFDDPIAPDMPKLDLITFLFYYHDTTYMNVDRAAMDRKMFDGLKPGGFLVLADHAAKPQADISTGKTLHRIDEIIVRKELEAAGFKLVTTGDFWRVPDDTRDFSSQHPTSPVDSFVLKYQKPQ
jgi:predicted methyltransferase